MGNWIGVANGTQFQPGDRAPEVTVAAGKRIPVVALVTSHRAKVWGAVSPPVDATHHQ